MFLIVQSHALDLLKGYSVELKGPFNYAARDKAGMPRDWLVFVKVFLGACT